LYSNLLNNITLDYPIADILYVKIKSNVLNCHNTLKQTIQS